MNRLTMIQERLLRIGVLQLARFGALSRRAALALMIALTAVTAWYPAVQSYAAHSSVPEMVSSSGRDFWLTYLYNFGQDNDNISLELSVVAMKADATVTITTGDGTPLLTSQAVSAGSAFTLEIPTLLRSKVYNTGSDVKRATGVHVQATSDVVVYLRNGYSSGSDFSYDISPVISKSALGTEYMIQTYYRDMTSNVFAIVATEDGTTVDIKLNTNVLKPSESLTDLYHKGDVLTRTLNAGEVIQIKGARYNSSGQGDLSGTTISSNKPIAVFNGGAKTSIPYAAYNGDHTVEQAIPISAWGKRFVAMEMSGFPVRDDADGHVEASSPTQYLITALYGDTYVFLDGSPIDTLAAGESLGYDKINALYYTKICLAYDEAPKLVETNKPVMLQAFMSSGAVNVYEYEGFLEPSTALIPDVNKGVDTSYIFCWDSPASLHYANVVVPAIGVSGMKLNGVDVSGQFTTMGTTFRDYPDYYAYARLALSDGVNVLTNNKARFVAVAYSAETYLALSEANAGLLNLAPTAPVVFIDDNEAIHMDTLEYCNQHPGIHFTAFVDYPHDSVRWYLGENVVVHETVPKDSYDTSHMYGQTLSESDTTHNIRFFIYRHSPITNVKDTDSVSMVLRVHPAYYDTLETYVAAKALQYEWINSSEHAFGLSTRGQYDLRYKDGNPANGDASDDDYGRRAAIKYGKDATNPKHKWTDPDNPEVTEIFDSLVYMTSTHGCDSIFYLKLHVTKNIIMPIDSDTICQHEVYAWPRHAAGAGHKLSRRRIGDATVYLCKDGGTGYGTKCDSIYATKVPGWYEIRDTIRSQTYPYPGEPDKNVDTIFIKHLHVSYKPTIHITNREDSLCEAIPGATLSWTVNYTAAYTDSLYYELRTSPGNVLKRSGGLRRTTQTSFNIGTLGTLEDGTYELSVQAFNDTLCESLVDKVPLVIKNRPWMKITRIDSTCYPVGTIVADYIHLAADTIIYTVDSVDGPNKFTNRRAIVDGTGKFSINTEGWPSGKYKVSAFPRTKHECDSTAVVTYFWIYKQPVVYDVHVYDTCYNVGKIRVNFKTKNDAKTYKYSFNDGATWLDGAADAAAEQTIEIALPSVDYAVGDHTLKLQAFAETGGCPSEIAEDEDGGFTIKPLPTGQISLTQELNSCAPCDHSLAVEYAQTDAKWIKWQLTKPGGAGVYPTTPEYVLVSETPTLNIPQAELSTPGGYTLSILSLKSDFGCEVTDEAHVGTARTFTMNSPATISVAHIDSVCEKQAIQVPTTTTFADSIFYVVKKGGVVQLRDTADIHDGTEVPKDYVIALPNTLSAGTYSIELTATNKKHCGSSALAIGTFKVNPLPTITLNAPSAICETEATKTVTFTKTNTLNVEYWLEKDAVTYYHQTIPAASGEIVLTTNTLADGAYTLKVTPISEHGCTGTQQTTTLTVHPQPLITLTDPGDACEKDKSINVNFTLEDAGTGTYTYTLYNPSNVAVIGPTNKAATASGTISLDISELSASASDYTLKVNAVSNNGCKAVEKQVTFKINTKPQAKLISVPEKCDNETSTTVTYNTTNADTCYYYIKSLGKGTMKGVKKSNGANGTFDLDISALNCVGTSDWVDTLFLVSNTATCHSDTAKMAFIIRVLPSVTLAPASVDACYPVETINVPYTSTNADSLVYTFTKSGALTPSLQGKVKASASGALELNTTGLTDETYTLTVNCFSTYKCNNSTPAVKTIKILKQPELTVDNIANICEHEVANINVTFTMNHASKYKYELKLGSTLVASGDDQTTNPLAIKADTLHAGNYSLVITAKSDDCGSTPVEKTFTVYPQPTVRINDAHRKDSICEANTDTWSMTYTASTNADSVHYWLKTDPALTLQKERGWKRTASETSFSMTGLASLPDGRYILIVQSYSQYDCKSVPDTVPFVIKNRPSLKVNAIAPKCYPADAFTVTYTPTDAATIIYSVDSLNGGNKIPATPITVQAGHSFNINTSGWLKGTYVLHAQPVSALGCDSLAENVQFTIVNQPEIASVQIIDTCVDATSTTVKFTATDASDYCYYIKSKKATTLSAWTAIGSGTFTISVAGNLAVGKDSLILVVKNGTTGCESDSARTEFEIFPLPTATITSTADELSKCLSYYKTNDMSVVYTSTADSVKWQLKRGSTTVYTSPYVKREVNIKVTSDKLTLADPSYTFSIIGLKTIHSCEVTTPISVNFALYDTAAIVLNHIDSVCEGTAVVSKYTATNTTSYTFKVDTAGVGGATKINHTTPVTTLDGVIDLSGTAALPAGSYILRVNATNAKNCGGAQAEMPFTINPMPEATITTDSATLSQCVTYYKSTDMHVAYTTTADSVKWVLTKGGANVTASTGYVPKSANITVPYDKLTYSGSDYTLTINGLKTVHGCEVTTPVSRNFALYDTAVVVLNAIAPVCEHNAVVATYTQTNTNSYTFRIDTAGVGGATKINHTTPVTTIDGKIDMSGTADLLAGTYTLRVFPTNSPHDCKGAEVKTNFTIYKEPTVDITSVTEKCEDTKTAVAITYNGASTHYIYWIDTITGGAPKIDKSATPIAIAPTFDADINGLKGGTYRLRIQTSNGTTSCVSEQDTLNFDIWPLPTITLSTDNIDECFPADTVTLPFTHTNADMYSYTLTKQGETDPAVTKSDISVVTATPMYLDTRNLAAGTYTVSVTAKSSDDCNMAVAQTRTFKILDKPSLTISHIDSVCHKTATVPVKITTAHATNYSFVVKDKDDATVDSGSGATTGSTATPVTTGFTVATATLAAGDYTVYVDVTNSGTGCASKQDTMVFTINPTPSITLAKPDSVCEGTATLEVPFATKSHTKTVSYYLMKGTTPTGITGTDVDVTSLNALTLSIGALNEGEYRLYVTPKSEHGCVGAEVDTTFYIKNKPDFTLTPEDHCAKDTFMDLTYTASADARTYTYYIYKVGGSSTPVLSAVDKILDGSPIKVNILSLSAANYRIEAHATSDLGCQSNPDTKFFEIFTKPDAGVTSMESVCEGSATAKATFTSANAASYYYEVEGTTPKISGTGLVADGNTFDVPVATLVASNVDKPYNLLFVTKSTTCESDTIRKPFAIWHIPAVTIDSVNDKCVGDLQTTVWCQPDDYTTQALLSLKRGTTPVITDSTVTLSATHKTFNIRIDALPVGVYTVELTPRSVHPTTTCTGAMVTGTFEIHPLPTISALTLDSAAVCEGTDSIHATFNHTGANSYSYELRRSGTTAVLRSGNKTGLTDATSKIGIDLLAPSELPTAQSYDLSVTMRSPFGCVKTETATFVIRKNPVVTLSQTYDRQCQPVDSVKIHYTNQGADNFRWEVRNAANTLIKKGTKLDISAEDDWTIRFTNRLDSGAYTLKVVPANACPGDEKSITFHVDTVIPIKTNVTICHGERYDWVIAADCDDKPDTLMRGLTATTHQMDTFYCGEGHCNKVYELNLTVLPEYVAKEESHILCQDEVWNWRGKAITEAGAYTDTVHGVATGGCDSIYRVQVSKVEPVEREESTRLCYGEELLFNGKTYKNLSVGQTVLFDTIASKVGCDSVYLRLNVQVGERYYDSVTVTECERYTWPVDGNTYTHSGIYRAEYATAEGCDSVYVLNLTINDKYEYYEAYDILDTQFPITVHDYTYNEDGTYTRPFTSQGGCDSIYHFTITSHPLVLPKDTIHPVICQSAAPYSWRDTTISNSGWFIKKTTVDGKDTIHVLHLTINPTYSDTTYVHECDSYTWHGTPYTASGIYNAPDVSSCGCDSSEVLVLTIGHPSNATVNTTVCQYELTTVGNRTFVPNETTYPSFTQTLTNAEGCDSVITYNVTVTPRTYTMPDDMFSFCEGKTYTWHGHTYDERGTYYDSVMDPNGCTTTIHTLHLTANPRYIFDEDVEVSERALPYVWRGHLGDTLLRTNGDYYERLATALGCDSIHHIHFHVNFVKRDTVYRNGCDSVLWEATGKYYKQSGLVSDTVFTDPADTDYTAVHFCQVTIHRSYDVVEPEFTVCSNETFTWHDSIYVASKLSVGSNNLATADTTVHGCDSIYRATVHVIKSFRDSIADEICPNELPYNWRGKLLTEAKVYYDSLISVTGCDSIYVLKLIVKPATAPTTELDTVCQGKTYNWISGADTLLTIPALELGDYSYFKWYTPSADCPNDSTYHRLDLTVAAPPSPIVTNATICHGEVFDWIVPGCDGVTPDTLMKGLTVSTHQTHALSCAGDQCDSIYELNLTVLPEYAAAEESHILCQDEVWYWRSKAITAAGAYTDTVHGVAAGGCDSIYRVQVSKFEPVELEESTSLCYGDSLLFNGKMYKNLNVGKTVLIDTIASKAGCDSVYLRLNVQVGNRYYDSVTVMECERYTWSVNGNTYTHSGIYRAEYATVEGCDSVYVLNLTINDKYEYYEAYDILDTQYPVTVHEYTYNEDGTYTRSFTSQGGCDSIYHFTITSHPLVLPKDTIHPVICQSAAPYSWRDTTISNSGWFIKKTTVDGNDTIHVLHLTINPTYSDTTYAHACGSYTWKGNDYTATGVYPVALTSACGCDSTVVLKLTVDAPTSSTQAVTVCQDELATVGKQTFLVTETTYAPIVETLTNAAGCDSTVTYNITVSTRAFKDSVDSICEGTPFSWRGHNYVKAGLYKDTLFRSNGCIDTIFRLDLKAKQKYYIDEGYAEVADDVLPFLWHGKQLKENNDYYDSLTSVISGCDSIHHIHFHVNFAERDTVDSIGCGSIKWVVNSKTYTFTETGLYSDTVFTDAPTNKEYNVIHFCNVTIYPVYHAVDPDVTICRNETFTWHGTTYEENHFAAGDTTLTFSAASVHGCDSTYTVALHVKNVAVSTQSYAACPTSELPYTWRGQLLSVAGTYTDSLTSANGCDSIFVMNFSVQTVTAPDVDTDTLCNGATLDWYDLSITATAAGDYTYYKYYTASGECDSTFHRLNLKVGEIYDVGTNDTVHICQGDAHVWYGIARQVRQIPANLQDDGTYAEDFDTVKLTYLGCDSLEAHLHLIMHLPDVVTAPAVVECDSFVWGDTTIFNSGTYTRVLASQYGCDSTVTINVTVNHSDFKHIYVDTCDGFYWNLKHQYCDTTGLYEFRVPQMSGTCDSVVQLHLTVRQTVRDTLPLITACDSFPWGETHQVYKTTGIYAGEKHSAANGCDSIPYLHLQINHSDSVDIYETACDTMTWHGWTYTGDTVVRYVTPSLITGCDSITKLHLTIRHSTLLATYDTLRNNCRVFDDAVNGKHYITTTDDTLHLTNWQSCDSTVYRHVIVTQPDSIYHTALHGCESLTWNGQTYYYTQDAQQDYLCDSVVFLSMIIDRNQESDIYVTDWDSYTWQAETFTSDTVVSKTLTAACGCDSVVTLHLTLNSSMSDEEQQHECQTYTWPWSGETYTETCDTTVTKRVDVGIVGLERDSTRTLHLTIYQPDSTAFEASACDYYAWHGATYYRDTTVVYEYTEICDNIDTLHLTVFHKVDTTYRDTACDVLTLNGKTYFSDTTFVANLHTFQNCDSTVTYDLKFHHRVDTTVYVDTCSTYLWEGTTYTRSGSYTKVLTGMNGCDSVVTLVLSIYPEYHHEFSAESCLGYYVWDNRIITTSGDHDTIYQSVSGCDSTVTLHLTLNAVLVHGQAYVDTVCEGMNWHGHWFGAPVANADTNYVFADTVSSLVTGCDSVAWLDLTVKANPRGEFSATATQNYYYEWRGVKYYASGDYEQRFASAADGCDSIVTMHLTINNPLPVTQLADTACDAYTWDSETFYESGTYTRNFPKPDGTDSIAELSLVVTHDTAVSFTVDTCEQYLWEGELYTESGIYSKVLTRASGCDSVVTLLLTVYQPDSTSFEVTARDIYTWEGQSYTASGMYTQRYSNAHGCDSLATLNLTIISNVMTDTTAEVCTQFVWSDSVYTHSTIHTEVYTAANGCDSIVTLTLAVHEPIYTDLFDTVTDCSDPTYAYAWRGQTIQHTGIYTDTLQSNVTGCDSILLMHLQWCDDTLCIDSTWFTVDTVCSEYVWDNETYNATGTYSRHYRLESGCDSVSTLRLVIRPKYQVVIDTTECDSLQWRDKWYYESGYYYDTVATVHGCDSVLILHAIVGRTAADSLTLTGCNAVTVNGETFTESGIYLQHLTTATGCDSLLTLNVTVKSVLDTIIDDVACDTLIWEGDTLTVTGFYPMVLTSSDSLGCDSVVNLHLIVYNHKEISVIDTLTCDSLVWGPDKLGNDTLLITDGIYTRTFLTATGCDSIVTMDLRLLHHDTITVDTASCDSLVWISQTIFASGTYIDTLKNSVTGCDSIITANVTINPTLYSDTTDTVAPPFHVWWLNGDTLRASGDYVDTVPSKVTGCDSIITLHLVMKDSIVLDSLQPVMVDTFGFCQGTDSAEIHYNLTRGWAYSYRLIFTKEDANPATALQSVTDTTLLPNGGKDSVIYINIPLNCRPGEHEAELQLFDGYSQSKIYKIYIYVSVHGVIVPMWTDVVAINNIKDEYIGYQWFKDGVELGDKGTKQYYSDGEDLEGFYRARLQLAKDSSWVYTCEEEFHLATDSLELIAYPTPAPVTEPVTIMARGILLEKLIGSTLTIYDARSNKIEQRTMQQRTEQFTLPAGLYIATLVTAEAEPRSATVKFTVF